MTRSSLSENFTWLCSVYKDVPYRINKPGYDMECFPKSLRFFFFSVEDVWSEFLRFTSPPSLFIFYLRRVFSRLACVKQRTDPILITALLKKITHCGAPEVYSSLNFSLLEVFSVLLRSSGSNESTS